MEGKKKPHCKQNYFYPLDFRSFFSRCFQAGVERGRRGNLNDISSKTQVAFKSTSGDITSLEFFCFSSTLNQLPLLISAFAQHACRHAPVPVVCGRGEYLSWQFEPPVERRLEFHETRGGSARGREHGKGQRFLLMGLANSRRTENNLSPHDSFLHPRAFFSNRDRSRLSDSASARVS